MGNKHSSPEHYSTDAIARIAKVKTKLRRKDAGSGQGYNAHLDTSVRSSAGTVRTPVVITSPGNSEAPFLRRDQVGKERTDVYDDWHELVQHEHRPPVAYIERSQEELSRDVNDGMFAASAVLQEFTANQVNVHMLSLGGTNLAEDAPDLQQQRMRFEILLHDSLNPVAALPEASSVYLLRERIKSSPRGGVSTPELTSFRRRGKERDRDRDRDRDEDDRGSVTSSRPGSRRNLFIEDNNAKQQQQQQQQHDMDIGDDKRFRDKSSSSNSEDRVTGNQPPWSAIIEEDEGDEWTSNVDDLPVAPSLAHHAAQAITKSKDQKRNTNKKMSVGSIRSSSPGYTATPPSAGKKRLSVQPSNHTGASPTFSVSLLDSNVGSAPHGHHAPVISTSLISAAAARAHAHTVRLSGLSGDPSIATGPLSPPFPHVHRVNSVRPKSAPRERPSRTVKNGQSRNHDLEMHQFTMESHSMRLASESDRLAREMRRDPKKRHHQNKQMNRHQYDAFGDILDDSHLSDFNPEDRSISPISAKSANSQPGRIRNRFLIPRPLSAPSSPTSVNGRERLGDIDRRTPRGQPLPSNQTSLLAKKQTASSRHVQSALTNQNHQNNNKRRNIPTSGYHSDSNLGQRRGLTRNASGSELHAHVGRDRVKGGVKVPSKVPLNRHNSVDTNRRKKRPVSGDILSAVSQKALADQPARVNISLAALIGSDPSPVHSTPNATPSNSFYNGSVSSYSYTPKSLARQPSSGSSRGGDGSSKHAYVAGTNRPKANVTKPKPTPWSTKPTKKDSEKKPKKKQPGSMKKDFKNNKKATATDTSTSTAKTTSAKDESDSDLDNWDVDVELDLGLDDIDSMLDSQYNRFRSGSTSNTSLQQASVNDSNVKTNTNANVGVNIKVNKNMDIDSSEADDAFGEPVSSSIPGSRKKLPQPLQEDLDISAEELSPLSTPSKKKPTPQCSDDSTISSKVDSAISSDEDTPPQLSVVVRNPQPSPPIRVDPKLNSKVAARLNSVMASTAAGAVVVDSQTDDRDILSILRPALTSESSSSRLLLGAGGSHTGGSIGSGGGGYSKRFSQRQEEKKMVKVKRTSSQSSLHGKGKSARTPSLPPTTAAVPDVSAVSAVVGLEMKMQKETEDTAPRTISATAATTVSGSAATTQGVIDESVITKATVDLYDVSPDASEDETESVNSHSKGTIAVPVIGQSKKSSTGTVPSHTHTVGRGAASSSGVESIHNESSLNLSSILKENEGKEELDLFEAIESAIKKEIKKRNSTTNTTANTNNEKEKDKTVDKSITSILQRFDNDSETEEEEEEEKENEEIAETTVKPAVRDSDQYRSIQIAMREPSVDSGADSRSDSGDESDDEQSLESNRQSVGSDFSDNRQSVNTPIGGSNVNRFSRDSQNFQVNLVHISPTNSPETLPLETAAVTPVPARYVGDTAQDDLVHESASEYDPDENLDQVIYASVEAGAIGARKRSSLDRQNGSSLDQSSQRLLTGVNTSTPNLAPKLSSSSIVSSLSAGSSYPQRGSPSHAVSGNKLSTFGWQDKDPIASIAPKPAMANDATIAKILNGLNAGGSSMGEEDSEEDSQNNDESIQHEIDSDDQSDRDVSVEPADDSRHGLFSSSSSLRAQFRLNISNSEPESRAESIAKPSFLFANKPEIKSGMLTSVLQGRRGSTGSNGSVVSSSVTSTSSAIASVPAKSLTSVLQAKMSTGSGVRSSVEPVSTPSVSNPVFASFNSVDRSIDIPTTSVSFDSSEESENWDDHDIEELYSVGLSDSDSDKQ